MSDWYVSSAAYATYTAFQTSHAYTVGDIIVPTAPVFGSKWVFRCTTSGTSTTEPTWNNGNNGTSTSGTAIFTNITGQSTYFWTAAAGDLYSIFVTSNRLVQGDRAFISSDHSETTSSNVTYLATISGWGIASQLLCVNRAGSTPPVAADLSTGATIGSSAPTGFALELSAQSDFYIQGITWQVTGTAGMGWGVTGRSSIYFKNCLLALNTASAVNFTTDTCHFILDDTQLSFGSSSQSIVNRNGSFPLTWFNTPNAIAGTAPTTLYQGSGIGGPIQATLQGVDISAITGTLFNNSSISGTKVLLDSCKVNSGVTRLTTTLSSDVVELINCYDGTNTISERYSISGSVKTETTITLTGGAQDDIGAFSHKMVSNTSIDVFCNLLSGFWIDVMNEFTGVSKTATVEIVSSTTLTNQDIYLLLEYEGTAGTSMTSFSSSFIATPLTTPTNVTASGSAWNSLPATPVTQQLQVTFTPQAVGRLRGQVRLSKASTTVYYNPQIRLL